MKGKINQRRLLIVILIILVILLLIGLIIYKVLTPNNDYMITYEEATLEKKEALKEMAIEDLSKKTEQERMEFYCAQFFDYVLAKDFDSAYDLLYDEYKENYFPTLESFKFYMLEYFPSEIAIRYQNIERLGNIYILWIEIVDVYNGKYGHNFDMNIVIRENAYNDVEMSFSKNSAVAGLEG